MGAVAIVSPMAATTPLWTLLFGVTLFKRESLTIRHLLIALLVVAGGVLIITG
jgi:drug/metabolite transporter (DMT)-like permease